MFGGLKIVTTPEALTATNERKFPASKHRSARIRKKLIKRFGGEFVMRPAIFKMGDTFICHPSLYAELVRQTKGPTP